MQILHRSMLSGMLVFVFTLPSVMVFGILSGINIEMIQAFFATFVAALTSSSLHAFNFVYRQQADYKQDTSIKPNTLPTLSIVKAILDHSPNLILIKDLEGRYVAGSQSAAAAHGFKDVKDLFNKQDIDLGTTENAIAASHFRQKVLEDGNQISFDLDIFDHRYGSVRKFATTYAAVRDETGKAVGLAVFGHDVTEREEDRERLKGSVHSLNIVADAKRRMLAGLSHDLRQPLSILSLSLTAMENAGISKRQMRLISYSVEMMTAMMNSLLDLCQSESGTVVVVKDTISSDILMRDILDSNQQEAVSKGLAIETFVSPDAPYIVSDPKLLTRVVGNLVQNAIRYTESGSIKVMMRPVADMMVEILVSDTGVGISESDLPFIWEEFQRVGDRKGSGLGTGLGLFIVQNHCKALDHPIQVVSEVGVGTTFRMLVPQEKKSNLGLSENGTEMIPL